MQQNCVHYTDLGQKIGKEPGVVYVSTNQGRKWMELAEFAKNRDGEDYLFLEHQLELFGDLCHVSDCNITRHVSCKYKYRTCTCKKICNLKGGISIGKDQDFLLLRKLGTWRILVLF